MRDRSFPHVFAACAIAAVLIISFAGCYTLLKHPRLSDEERSTTSEASDAPVTYSDDCSSCHESPSYAAVHGYGSPHRSSYDASYDRWYYYYEYPWWIRYSQPQNGGAAAEQQQRPFGRRHRGENDNEPSQPAVSGSDQTPPPSPSVVSKSGNDAGKSEPPAQKDERRDERRGGSETKEPRRERKP